VAGSCLDGNELSSSLKGSKLLSELSDIQVLKEAVRSSISRTRNVREVNGKAIPALN
jgi:hypothetical protein